MRDDEPAAKQALADLRDIFGPDRFFVEQMDHGIDHQARNWPILDRLADDLGLRTVITNDSHYTSAADAQAHDALLCIQTGSRITDEKRFRFSGPEYYLRSAEEMWRKFGSTSPDALRATLDIAEMATATLEFGLDLLPAFPCPDGMTESEFLRQKVWEGARPALRLAGARRRARPHRVRAVGHRQHGLPRLLPHRRRPVRLRPVRGDPRRAGAWVGRRVRRGLLHRASPRSTRSTTG